MLVYLFCFGVTLSFAWINERFLSINCQNKKSIWLTAAIIILLPALLAGCRDNTIGTDIYFYAKNVYDSIAQLGIQDVMFSKNHDLSRIEPGFKLLAYFARLIFDSFHGFLFLISLVINGTIYLALYKLRDNCSIFVGEWLYLFLCYNETYNLMRQCLAMGFILLALSCLLKKKYWSVVPLTILAISFHFSAIIAVGIYMVVLFLEIDWEKNIFNSVNSRNYKWIMVFTLAIGVVMLAVLFRPITLFFIKTGIINAKYIGYLSGKLEGAINFSDVRNYFIPYLFLLLNGKKIQHIHAFTILAFCDLAFYYLRSQLFWLYRISTYFFYIRILSLSSGFIMWDRLLDKGKITREGAYTLLLLLFAVYFWYSSYIVSNYNETYPYLSALLGIY